MQPKKRKKWGAHCVPCEGGTPPLSKKEAEEFLSLVPNWQLAGNKIDRLFVFKNFKQAMTFVNKVAVLAEKEGHHPDIAIHGNKVNLVLWTHAVGGLSENDFILASKINALKV